MKKKWISLLLTGTMVFGTALSSQAGEAPANWEEPYAETVTISVAREAAAFEFPEGDDITNNIWTRTFKEKLNIDVVTEWVSDEYDTKLNLAIASGDLPDVFTVTSAQLEQLIAAGQLMDLTEVYNTYASDTLKVLESAEEEVFATAQADGALYAIPRLYNSIHPKTMWLRQDWMAELGMEYPKTVEELETVLMAMKELSGAGYSFAADQTLASLYGLASAWGAYPTIWVRDAEGKIVHGATAPEMKDALAAWAGWYEKGILKQDFATMDFDALREDVVAGNVGVDCYESWWGWTFGMDMTKNLGLEAYFVPGDIPTVSGESALYPLKFLNEEYIVVNKDCENPEAVMKLISFFVYILNDAYPSGDMTPEEIEVFTANNMQHATNVFSVCNSTDDYGRYAMVAEAFATGDESVLKTGIAVECYNGSKMWIADQNPDGIGYALQFGMENCGMSVNAKILNEDRLMRSELWGSSPQVLLDYGSTLDDILLEGFTKIIMGAEEVDYFDTLVEQWYTAGGQAVTDAMNEKFQ